MTKAGQEVEIRTRKGWRAAVVAEVQGDGTLVVEGRPGVRVSVAPGMVRRCVRLHPKRARAARGRAHAMRDLGMVRTPYGWE